MFKQSYKLFGLKLGNVLYNAYQSNRIWGTVQYSRTRTYMEKSISHIEPIGNWTRGHLLQRLRVRCATEVAEYIFN